MRCSAIGLALALGVAMACTQETQNRPGEKKIYFEVSDYSTPYVFYENPL